jgi:hypothetical protein
MAENPRRRAPGPKRRPRNLTLSDDTLSPALARLRRLLAHRGPRTDWHAEYRDHVLKKHVAERKR